MRPASSRRIVRPESPVAPATCSGLRPTSARASAKTRPSTTRDAGECPESMKTLDKVSAFDRAHCHLRVRWQKMAIAAGSRNVAVENVDRVRSRITNDEILGQVAGRRQLAVGFDRLTPSGVDVV